MQTKKYHLQGDKLNFYFLLNIIKLECSEKFCSRKFLEKKYTKYKNPTKKKILNKNNEYVQIFLLDTSRSDLSVDRSLNSKK